jgi:hypothetical protein
MPYVYSVVINLIGAALIAFGVHGCSQGSDVYGWAVFGGLCLLGHEVVTVSVKRKKK